MRRHLGSLMGTLGVGAVILSVGAAIPQSSSHGLLYLRTQHGVSVVDSSTGEATFSARNALPTSNWSLVVRARSAAGHSTVVEAVEPGSGEVYASQAFDGSLDVRAVSSTGSLVALMPHEARHEGGNGLYRPASRDHTQIVVSRLDGTAAHTINLAANVEPEAFSTDGTALFVIRYSPALHPDRYRVTRLDLATGELGDVYTNEKELQGTMRGIAYTQALAPDGTKLYTFYRKPNGEAFVHVLDLAGQRANCVDLPEGFGKDPSAVAITTSASGDRVVVVDGARRQIVDVDPNLLKIVSSHRFDGMAPTHHPVSATATANGVFVSTDSSVVELRRSNLQRVRTWSTKSSVRSLHLGANGLVLVAERDRVTAIDPRSRGRGWSVEIPGGGIRTVADALAATAKGSVQCAC